MLGVATSYNYINTTVMCVYIPTAHSRLSIKSFLPFLAQLAPNWFELGAMLLEEKQETQLNLIQDTYGVDKKKCCLIMLQYWMSTHSEATWHHLVTALRSPDVDLTAIASDIEANLQVKSLRCFIYYACAYYKYAYTHNYL